MCRPFKLERQESGTPPGPRNVAALTRMNGFSAVAPRLPTIMLVLLALCNVSLFL